MKNEFVKSAETIQITVQGGKKKGKKQQKRPVEDPPPQKKSLICVMGVPDVKGRDYSRLI